MKKKLGIFADHGAHLSSMATTTQNLEAQDVPPQSGTSPPLVFQCSSCSQIVADSFSWVCSHRQLNSFTTAGIQSLYASF
jgi:hypothetical protein